MNKRTNKKIIISILIIVMAVIMCASFVACGKNVDGKPVVGNVELSIMVTDILANYDKLPVKLQDEKFVPKDGAIVAKKSFGFAENETVFDLLKRVAKKQKVTIDYSTPLVAETAYIKGINSIYEKDCGDMSGWLFKVNGVLPNFAMGGVKLVDKDVVLIYYTCDMMKEFGSFDMAA